MGSLFLKELFYRAGLLGKVGWRGSLAVMWGELGGAWWGRMGLSIFVVHGLPFLKRTVL
ncbi:hypothetical protein [Bartonella sp. AA2SXKL]|uniref:hypothetical protein n=1 Tax=Bartonella sp. AA2SXKL TaxID=3243432 RepID=UPI0035D0779D